MVEVNQGYFTLIMYTEFCLFKPIIGASIGRPNIVFRDSGPQLLIHVIRFNLAIAPVASIRQIKVDEMSPLIGRSRERFKEIHNYDLVIFYIDVIYTM